MPDGSYQPQASDLAQLARTRDLLMILDLEHLAGERPLERLGQYLVEVADEVQDLGSQVPLGRKTAPADNPPDQNAEPDLHLVQPRTVLGRVDQADAMTQ